MKLPSRKKDPCYAWDVFGGGTSVRVMAQEVGVTASGALVFWSGDSKIAAYAAGTWDRAIQTDGAQQAGA